MSVLIVSIAIAGVFTFGVRRAITDTTCAVKGVDTPSLAKWRARKEHRAEKKANRAEKKADKAPSPFAGWCSDVWRDWWTRRAEAHRANETARRANNGVLPGTARGWAYQEASLRWRRAWAAAIAKQEERFGLPISDTTNRDKESTRNNNTDDDPAPAQDSSQPEPGEATTEPSQTTEGEAVDGASGSDEAETVVQRPGGDVALDEGSEAGEEAIDEPVHDPPPSTQGVDDPYSNANGEVHDDSIDEQARDAAATPLNLDDPALEEGSRRLTLQTIDELAVDDRVGETTDGASLRSKAKTGSFKELKDGLATGAITATPAATNLMAAILFAESMKQQADGVMTSIDRAKADLALNGVEGRPIDELTAASDHAQGVWLMFGDVNEALRRQIALREIFLANDETGSKAFVAGQ